MILKRLIVRLSMLTGWLRRALQRAAYRASAPTLWVACWVMAARIRARPGRGVLHISYMVHVPYYTASLLKRRGIRADYLAVGRSSHWDKADYCFEPPTTPLARRRAEFRWLWSVLARYRVVHAHFMITPSQDGWEVKWLKRAGVRLVAHFRGCEARDRTINMRLHPEVNICQQCDYVPHTCELPVMRARRALAQRYADRVLVTTRDMLDFMPTATQFPFFAPLDASLPSASGPRWPERTVLRLVHVTSHPGIEGRQDIERAVEALRARGRPIEFVPVTGVTHEAALEALADADLAIGKMKMGDYANAQIESMMLGVPTITWVRPEFRTPELEASGFILSHLGELERTLDHILDNPAYLEEKRRISRQSILRLHDNDRLVERLCRYYEDMAPGGGFVPAP